MAPFCALLAVSACASATGVKPLSNVDPSRIFSVVQKREEDASPKAALSGRDAPLPTNAWWTNLATAEDTELPEGNIFQMPYIILTSSQGLHAMQPFTTGATTQGFERTEALTLSAAEAPEGPKVVSWDELTVTLKWRLDNSERGMTAPLVRGSPYITAEYAGVTPLISTEQQVRPDGEGAFKIRVDGQPQNCDGGAISGKAFLAELVESDATWAIFSPPDVQWSCTPEPFSLKALDPLEKGAVRAAIANSCTTGVRPHHCQDAQGRDASAYSNLLEAHAGAYPVSASVSWEARTNEGDVTWKFGTRQLAGHDSEPLLHLSYPVHQPLLSDDARNTVQGDARMSPFSDIRGLTVPIVGDSWVLTYPLFPDMGLRAPRPIAKSLREDMLKALRGPGGALGALWNNSMPDKDFDLPLNYKLGVGDTYFSGKMLGRLARIIAVADELGESEETYFADMVDRLTKRVEVWLREDAEAPFVYDSVWGGLLSCGCMYDDCEGKCDPHCANDKKSADDCPALKVAGMNFGNGYYNDHHFHYGYFVYAAAVAAKYAPRWEEEWRDQILAIVRDYANPSADDTSFPVARHKDWFLGFSWAGGIPESYANGRNQESTSEAIHSYYAVYAYGASVDAPFASELKDFGRILMAMESHGADTYWHVRKGTGIYPDDFPDQVVGILWDHVVEHQTWFGGAPYIVSGIQLLPMVPAMENFLDPDWVKTDSAVYKEQCEEDPECETGWSWPMCLEQAILDPIAAYKCIYALPKNAFSTNNAAANGNSLTNSLHWIATRPEADSAFEAASSASNNGELPPPPPPRNDKTTKRSTTTSVQPDASQTETTEVAKAAETQASTTEETTRETTKDTAQEAAKETTPEVTKGTTKETTQGTTQASPYAVMIVDGNPTNDQDDYCPGPWGPDLSLSAEVGTPDFVCSRTTARAAGCRCCEPTSSQCDTNCTTFTYDECAAKCAAVGARMCAKDEVLAGIVGYTGCGYDHMYVWTRTTCVLEEAAPTTTIEPTIATVGAPTETTTLQATTTTKAPTAAGRSTVPTTKPSTSSVTTTFTVTVQATSEVTSQEVVVDREPIRSGDVVFLRAHTGSYLDVQDAEVRARWNMQGEWQQITIEKEDGGTLLSEDTVFLVSSAGANIDVDGDTVRARWSDKRLWQEFVIEKDGSDGAIWSGDVVYFTAHTGKCLDVQQADVYARWPMHGPWQAFTIEKAPFSSKRDAVAQEGGMSRNAPTRTTTTEDPLMQWEKMGVVQIARSGGDATALRGVQSDKVSDEDYSAALSKEQKESILGALKLGIMKRFDADANGPDVRRGRRWASSAGRLAVLVSGLCIGGLVLVAAVARRALQCPPGWPGGSRRYQAALMGDDGHRCFGVAPMLGGLQDE